MSKILIHTDKQQYLPGEEVTGQVTLTLDKPLKFETINLTYSGYEHAEFYFSDTQVTTTSGSNAIATRTTTSAKSHVSETNTIYGRKYVLYECHSILEVGCHCFPFKLRLKQKLPGSFWFEKDKFDGHAEVDYQIKAEVVGPCQVELGLSCAKELVIIQPLEDEVMSSETYQEANVSFMYCIPRGKVSLSAAVDKNSYTPGEPIMLSLIVDNSRSSVDLPSFSFKLQRVISLRAKEKTHYKVLTVAKSKIDGVPNGQRADRLMTVHLPVDTEPSTDGCLVKCYYELIVELQVPWSPNIMTKTPVQVIASPRETYSAPLATPPSWSTKTMPIVDLNSLPYES